ncbi:MAG: TIM barrel protein [Chitinophagaceae bacterium]|nr:TIM barrel protein [Chitinophagaceae bacterium]
MHRYGLKLWSTNGNYVDAALRLYDGGVYSYIELFVVPGTYDDCARFWTTLKIPFIIHAPHFDKGVNLAIKRNLEANLLHAAETIKFADALKADTIIFHPGIEGDVRETVDQLRMINEPRVIIENKPYFGFNDVICVGSSPEELEFILANADVGFCLDIGHAICAANARTIDPMEYLAKFIVLTPRIYHLTDGKLDSMYDRHDHFGKGDYNIPNIVKLLPHGSVITVETDKDSTENLDDFAEDISYLKSVGANLASEV